MKQKFNAPSHFWVHTSSRLEALFDALSKLIFSDGDPFAERIIVIPSPAMQSYLSFELAKRFPVLANVKFFSSRQAISFIQKKIERKKGRFVPTALEIEAALLGEIPEERGEMREEIAKLFLRYGLNKVTFSEEGGWQERLYHKLFNQNQSWITPYEEIAELIEQKEPDLSSFTSVFLFGIGYLPPLDESFYLWLSKSSPVHDFVLLPSPHFLLDELSDAALRERGTLLERHPLIANLGRLVKERQRRIADLNVTEISHFQEIEGDTLLHSLQRGFQELKTAEVKERVQNKRSIELHHASSPFREVEILYDLLAGALAEGIPPEEIIVLAPDNAPYIPLIKAYFHDFPVGLEMLDLQPVGEDEAVTAFTALLHLIEGSFTKEQLLKFVSHPLAKIKEAEESIKSWLKDAAFSVGRDAKTRREWLLEEGLESKELAEGTLRWSLERLLERNLKPTEFSELDLFFEFYREIEALERLKGAKKSAREWKRALRELWARFFREGAEPSELLSQFFESIGSIERSCGEKEIPWSFVKRAFDRFIEGRELSFSLKDLTKIRFSSLLPMRAIPADLIILMGVSCDNFPKKEEQSLLDLTDKSHFIPKRQEFDRALFLDTLLSARKHLWFLCNREEEKSPSSLIEELLSYVDSHYTVEGELEIVHPEKGYQKENFIKPFSSYNALNFSVAMPTGQEIGFKSDLKRAEKKRSTISPSLFQLAAKDAISLYFKEGLKIRLEEEEEEPFSLLLSPKRERSILFEMVERGDEVTLKREKEHGHLSVGAFGKREEERLKERSQEMRECIGGHPLFHVELTSHVKGVKQIGERFYAVEAPRITLEDHEIEINGTLRQLSAGGLLLPFERKKERIVAEWGRILLWNWIAKKMEIEPHIIFLAEREKESAKISEIDEALSNYGTFFRRAASTLLLLDARRIAAINESKDFEELPLKKWNPLHKLVAEREKQEDFSKLKSYIEEAFLWDHPLFSSMS